MNARSGLQDDPAELYVKDVTYAGTSVLHQTLHLGTAMGNAGLIVLVARDGGTVRGTVASKDGNPIGDCSIVIIPSDTPSEGALSAFAVFGTADQNGLYTSMPLRPAKYLVLATKMAIPMTPEGMSMLWQSRSLATEVDIGPKAEVRVLLTPVDIAEKR